MEHDEAVRRAKNELTERYPEAKLYEEVVLNKYTDYHTRADILMVRQVDGSYIFHGVEVKSGKDGDNLERLSEQMESYSKSCLLSEVWAPKDKMDTVRRFVADQIGLNKFNGMTYIERRFPISTPEKLVPEFYLKLLWRDFLLELIDELDITPTCINGYKSKQKLRKDILSKYNSEGDLKLYHKSARIFFDNR